ncbi:MAG: hypothetical protein N2445_01760 [Acidobacteria bacterium]|nr:hypothetical protein [Acidobacteriota bacterium]
MKKIIAFIVFAVIYSSFCLIPRDLPPKPKFDTPFVECKVTLSQEGMWKCHYEYYVTNLSTNQAECSGLEIVIGGNENDIELVGTNPQRDSGRVVFRNPSDPSNIPFTPSESYISWIFDTGEGVPGTKEGPFGYTSPYPPQIREAWVDYDFFPYVDSLLAQGIELTKKELDDLQFSGIRKIKTLGPLKKTTGGFEYWNQFLSDIDEARNLNWIKDSNFFFSVKERLLSAHQAALDNDLTTLDSKLQEVVNLVEKAGSAILTQEGKDLLSINAKWLQGYIPWPCEPKLAISPLTAKRVVGELHTVSAHLENQANRQPLANEPVAFSVKDGPNAGGSGVKQTDLQGNAVFSYFGRGIGTDTIVAQSGEGGGTIRTEKKTTKKSKNAQIEDCHPYGNLSNDITVQWKGGIDLSVVHFTPSYLISKPKKDFFVSDLVMNEGDVSSPPTVVKYFLSTNEDNVNGVLVGKRDVKALEPQEMNKSGQLTFSTPSGLPEGKYYLWACIDPDDNIIEINEYNNCSYMNPFIAGSTLSIVAPENTSPDCSKAKANPDVLWPPNHKVESIKIEGITDKENDPFTITVTSITQDEPVNGLGDGDTSPDGFGAGTSNPQVRSERSGKGNGRVYQINFKAVDSKGGECNGSVKVGVPHDKKDTPVDDGQNYDSTKP